MKLFESKKNFFISKCDNPFCYNFFKHDYSIGPARKYCSIRCRQFMNNFHLYLSARRPQKRTKQTQVLMKMMLEKMANQILNYYKANANESILKKELA